MTCGDLLFTYKDNIENSKVYIAYDKNLAVGANFWGVYFTPLKQVELEKISYEIFQPREELSYQKRKKLSDHLLSIVNKTVKLSISERLNFLTYINMIYGDLLKIDLLEHPSVAVTQTNISESNELIKSYVYTINTK